MSLSTAKGISIFFDEVCELWDANNVMARQCDVFEVAGDLMQNSVNTVWRQVEQFTPEKTGWDMSNQFGDVIELSYPSSLSDPRNDAFSLRADDFRDDRFMKRRAMQAVNTLSARQNGRIAQLVRDTGTLAYTYTDTPGYKYIAEAETIMDTLELSGMGDRSFFLKPANHEEIAADLANRGTLSGRPEGAYGKSMVGTDIASFDVFRSNALASLEGSAATGVTMGATYSGIPAGSAANLDGTEVPVDYRSATLTLSDTSDLKRGDKFTVDGVFDVSRANKIEADRLATFSVVEVVDGTTAVVFPNPIAWSERPVSDGGTGTLTAEQAAYANVSNPLASGAAITVLNANAANGGLDLWQPDAFWTNDSIEIVAGNAPFEFMAEMDGFTVIKDTLDSGVTVYMMYQGSIATATLDVRVFVWYGLVNRKPDHNGIALPNFS